MPLSANAALSKDKSTGQSAKLQHRHFACIAAIISRLDADIRERAARRFCRALGNTNDNFDRERFLRACDLDTIEYETILRDQEAMDEI